MADPSSAWPRNQSQKSPTATPPAAERRFKCQSADETSSRISTGLSFPALVDVGMTLRKYCAACWKFRLVARALRRLAFT